MREGVIQRLMGIGDVDWDPPARPNDADFTFYGIDDPSTWCTWSITTTRRGHQKPSPEPEQKV